jgi:hypothetical protein
MMSASIGAELFAEQRNDGSIPSPTLHSNTVLAFDAPPGAVTLNPPIQASVKLTPLAGTGMSATLGTFINNIFQFGPGLGTAYAFWETDDKVDPKVIQFNDYVYNGAGGPVPLNPPLYVNEGTTVLTTAASIDALTDTTASNSQSMSPGFTTVPHLAASSPLRSLGSVSAMMPPLDDYDGDPRPRADGGVDIGADQLVP